MQQLLPTRASPRKENTRHSRKHLALPERERGQQHLHTWTVKPTDTWLRSHWKYPTVLTCRLETEDTASPQTECADGISSDEENNNWPCRSGVNENR